MRYGQKKLKDIPDISNILMYQVLIKKKVYLVDFQYATASLESTTIWLVTFNFRFHCSHIYNVLSK